MKDTVIQALKDLVSRTMANLPTTKWEVVQSDCILDINPLELGEYMRIHNIPKTAEFSGIDNGYDGYSGFCLEWKIEVPISDAQKLSHLEARLKANAFTVAAKAFKACGYTRVSYRHIGFNEVESLIKGEWDKLYDHYAKFWKSPA